MQGQSPQWLLNRNICRRLLRAHPALSCAAAMITPGGSPSQAPQVFGIAFSTPVSDSRGAPHALEHSVLVGGTQKYPVKVGRELHC